jgi:hypothetical protein
VTFEAYKYYKNNELSGKVRMGKKTTMKPNISKSQYIKGLKCEKSLWLYRNSKKLKNEFNNSATQSLFDMGNEVGAVAQKYYKSAVTVDAPYWDTNKAVKLTEDFISKGKQIIHEATAINPNDGSYAKIDILKKVRGSDEWDLIEVKSGSSTKPDYIDDIAFQHRVFKDAGYKIRKCIVMHINSNYVRQGEVNPKRLFKQVDLTDEAKAKYDEVANNVERLNKVLALKNEPSRKEENHCSRPAVCMDTDSCWGEVPLYSVFNAFTANKANDVVRLTGSYDVGNIPPSFSLSYMKDIEVECHKNNQAHADKSKIGGFLDSLEYPLYYLDYESVMSAVPLYDGTKPYQHVPFQFSLHIQEKPEGPLKHVEYLHKENTDPREGFVKELVKSCGKKGSVIVYSQSFEEGRNKDLAKAFPKYKKELEAINSRMVDLLVPFRGRFLYHPDQAGSASLKKVLPAWTDVTYDNMDLSDGLQAMNRYRSFVEGKMNKKETKKLWKDLSSYCTKDTYAMVALIKAMSDIRTGRKKVPQVIIADNNKKPSGPK